MAPFLVREITPGRSFASEHQAEKLLCIMLKHGHIPAFDYVVDCDVPFGFPFGYAANLMQMSLRPSTGLPSACSVTASKKWAVRGGRHERSLHQSRQRHLPVSPLGPVQLFDCAL